MPANRGAILRKPLYLVLFSDTLHDEVERAATYFRERDPESIAEVIGTIRLELAEPSVALRELDKLHARFSEEQLREFLRELADRLSEGAT